MQKVTSTVINSISASQIQRSGAAFGDTLIFDGTTQTWKPSAPSGGSTIVFTQSAGVTSADLVLPAGTWLITAYFCNHEPTCPARGLIIDGSVVFQQGNGGDPAGSTYRPMMGMRQVTGGRTITCSVTGIATEMTPNDRNFVVRGDKVG